MAGKLRTVIGVEDEQRREDLEKRLMTDLDNNLLEVHIAELFAAARAIKEFGVLSVLGYMNEEVKKLNVNLPGKTVQENLNEVAEVLDVTGTELPYSAELLKGIYNYQRTLAYKTGFFYKIAPKRMNEIENYVQSLKI